MLTFILLSCAGPITNSFLLEDQEFLNALPQREQHRILPDDTANSNDLQLTAADFNATFTELLVWVDAVRALPPTERTEDARVWGPHIADDNASLYWQVNIERVEPGRFAWAFALRLGPTGDWVTFFEGDYLAGFSTAEGQGRFFYSLDLLSDMGASDVRGSILVEYDYIGEHELYAELSLDDFSATYWYREEDDVAEAWFMLPLELYYPYPGDEQKKLKEENIPEDYAVAARWLSAGAGRLDAHISAGNLNAMTVVQTQCWSAGGEVVYDVTTCDLCTDPAEGDISDCVFSDGADPLDPPD